MTISRKSHKKDRKVDGGQDLADLKFKYDLLTNELFHLREFISLVDYDPTHFNDTESFQKFLQDTHLSLEDGEEEPVNDLILTKKSTNGEHTRRRRNLRTSTIVGSDTTNYKTDDIELKLENIAPLVRNKCEKLKKKTERSFKYEYRGTAEEVTGAFKEKRGRKNLKVEDWKKGRVTTITCT